MFESEEAQDQGLEEEGERSDREEGGPTSPEDKPQEDVPGGGPSRKPDSGFDSHE